jgi:hypothetical protein
MIMSPGQAGDGAVNVPDFACRSTVEISRFHSLTPKMAKEKRMLVQSPPLKI